MRMCAVKTWLKIFHQLAPALALWGFTAHAQTSEAPVRFLDLHYGKLTSAQLAVLEKKFEPSLNAVRTSLASYGVELRVRKEITTADLIHSLGDPTVVGVVLVGHPALTVDTSQDQMIKNAFLIDTKGRYLPKNIFTAAHPDLRLIGIVTCHHRAVVPRYRMPGGLTDFETILPKIDPALEDEHTDAADLNSALLQLTPLVDGPNEVLQKALERIKKLAALPSWANETQRLNALGAEPAKKAKIQIDFRDLYSPRFAYEVRITAGQASRLAATLESATDTATGLRLNRQSHVIEISESTLEALGPDTTLVIQVDDPDRPRLANDPAHLIDDILIDQITITTEAGTRALLNAPVHLGDDAADWDRAIRSFNAANDADFGKTAPQDQLEIRLGRP